MSSVQEKFIFFQFYIGFFLLGCTDVNVQQEKNATTSIGANEKISFILDRSTITSPKDASKIELKIEKCIDKALKRLDPTRTNSFSQHFSKGCFS